MLVNSFDTKYSKTAYKYELLDDNFTSLFSKDKKFSIYLPPGYKKSNQTQTVDVLY